MKITRVNAGRADDLRRERDDWDTRNNAQKAKHETQYSDYKQQARAVFDAIKEQVEAHLSGIKLNLQIRVDHGMSFRGNAIEVQVSNENDRSETNALRWTWKINIDGDGNIKSETNSWSGLEAVTLDQVNSLKETARAMEILVGIDWVHMLTVTLPEYKDIVTEMPTIGQRPNFDQDIAMAEVEESIGQNILVKGSPMRGGGRGGSWYKIVSASPKQFKVVEIPAYEFKPEYMEQRGRNSIAEVVDAHSRYVDGIAKERFFRDVLNRPIETMEY